MNLFRENGIDYMGFRAWVGLWTALILIIIVVTDCSALVKYITRFTGIIGISFCLNILGLKLIKAYCIKRGELCFSDSTYIYNRIC